MSIGLSSPARYSLSYVDSLLTDFTQYPQKSIQFVFQRLLVTCGADCGSPAVHCARVLLSAVGFGQPLPAGPRRSLDESTAAQLIFLIVKFATEEQPSRSVLELAGARHIFNALTDRVSAELQDAEASNDSQLPLLVQSVSSKLRSYLATWYQSLDSWSMNAVLVRQRCQNSGQKKRRHRLRKSPS